MSVIFRADIIREKEGVARKVEELGSQLAAYKRTAADCETSARFYSQEAARLTREAEEKRAEASRLQEEVKMLLAAKQF